MKAILYYIHDPMCSWCWGFSRVYNQLLEKLPREIEVQRLLGGLAKDTDIAMPVDMQETIKSNWLRIEEHIAGIKFNFDFGITIFRDGRLILLVERLLQLVNRGKKKTA